MKTNGKGKEMGRSGLGVVQVDGKPYPAGSVLYATQTAHQI